MLQISLNIKLTIEKFKPFKLLNAITLNPKLSFATFSITDFLELQYIIVEN